jgi:Methyltransferase domain
MFTLNNRTDVDVVEQDFVKFKKRIGEIDEVIIEKVLADNIYTPILLERNLETTELKQLEELSPWGYSFRVCPGITTNNIQTQNYNLLPEYKDPGLIEMDLRISMLDFIFEKYVTNNSKSWLDVATNGGIIPLFINRKRQIKVTGIDLFSQNIEKANCLSRMSGDNNSLSFAVADAYDFLRECKDESFDIISALGLFYHLSDPIGLMNLIYQKSRQTVVIDTIVHNFDFSGWIQTVSRHLKYPDLAHANDTRKVVELHPTYRGLVDTLFQVGFSDVIEIIPSPNLLIKFPSYIYSQRNRAMFVAVK